MRIAVLSDIHSNVFALEAVINHLSSRAVDHCVNLGDILYGPIAPRQTYDLLMEHNFITISGNQDRQIYQASEAEKNANPTLQFILQQLGQEPLAWLQSLPFDQQLTPDVYLCHGTPSDDLVYLLEDVSLGYPRLRQDQEITQLLGEQRSDLILCGHSHTPRTVNTSTQQLIVNPGSVGLPAYCDDLPLKHCVENYSAHASYAIIEDGPAGWMVEHMKVSYDTDKAVRQAQQQSRFDWAVFLSSGRVGPA